jgi:hypothetical protein
VTDLLRLGVHDVGVNRLSRFRAGLVCAPLLLGLGYIVGCSNGRPEACTAIGCEDGVRVNFDQHALQPESGEHVELCVDGHCTTESARSAANVAAISLRVPHRQATVHVTARITGPTGVVFEGETTTPLRRVQPNGRRCEPVCYFVNLTLDSAGLRPTRAA